MNEALINDLMCRLAAAKVVEYPDLEVGRRRHVFGTAGEVQPAVDGQAQRKQRWNRECQHCFLSCVILCLPRFSTALRLWCSRLFWQTIAFPFLGPYHWLQLLLVFFLSASSSITRMWHGKRVYHIQIVYRLTGAWSTIQMIMCKINMYTPHVKDY